MCIRGYISMCSPKGWGLSAFLVINREWFLHSSLKLDMLFLKKLLYHEVVRVIGRVLSFCSSFNLL